MGCNLEQVLVKEVLEQALNKHLVILLDMDQLFSLELVQDLTNNLLQMVVTHQEQHLANRALLNKVAFFQLLDLFNQVINNQIK